MITERRIAEQIERIRADPILTLIDAVCVQTGTRREEILSPWRGTKTVSEARQQVMYLAREAGASIVHIANVLRRDTQTVQHGIKAEKARRGL